MEKEVVHVEIPTRLVKKLDGLCEATDYSRDVIMIFALEKMCLMLMMKFLERNLLTHRVINGRKSIYPLYNKDYRK